MPDNALRFRIDIRSDEYGRFGIFFLGGDLPGIPVSEVVAALNGTAYNLLTNPPPNGLVPLYQAPPVLPEGWEPTLDGVSREVNTGAGTVLFTRTWKRLVDGAVVTAPCAADGEAVPATVAALSAYDAEHPIPEA